MLSIWDTRHDASVSTTGHRSDLNPTGWFMSRSKMFSFIANIGDPSAGGFYLGLFRAEAMSIRGFRPLLGLYLAGRT